MPQCKAYSRRTGQQCGNRAIKGREVCRMHGGKSPRPGPAHPRFKDGRYSKVLEGSTLEELYARMRQDPKLLHLKEEIALLTARQQETLERAKRGESHDAWSALHAMLNDLDSLLPTLSLDEDEFEEVRGKLRAMLRITRGELGERAAWNEFEERAEIVRKLVDTERKYEEGLRLYLPLDRANAIMQVWLDAIRRIVPPEYVMQLRDYLQQTRGAIVGPMADSVLPPGKLPRGRNVSVQQNDGPKPWD